MIAFPALPSNPSQHPNSRLRFAVGIATTGRPAILAETLTDLFRQTRPPDQVFVTYSKVEDVLNLPERFPAFTFTQAQGGACEKRNRIIDAAGDFDILFFMDDDFYLDPEYVRATEHAFLNDAHVIATSGVVLADGAKGPGLTLVEARKVLDAASASERTKRAPQLIFNTYGCNMAFRLATVREHGIRFDEQLPAYAWYEDIDFSRRLARFGSMVRVYDALGVHLGAKVGRASGIRLGYSQVANPIYLSRKGSFPWDHTLRSVGRHILANLVRSIAPESYIDRRGRMRGNWLAIFDLVRGRMRPDRILQLR